MSKYGICIKHAELKDQDKIIEFLKEHWQKDHVFVVCPDLFEYYHVIDGKLTFVIAEDEITKKIYGLHGYIASNNSENPDVWGVIWKTISSPYPFLGIEIMKFIRKSINCRIFAGCGANPKTTIPLLKFLKAKTGTMDHYYRIADKQNYIVADISKKMILPIVSNLKCDLVMFNSLDELKQQFEFERYKDRKPYKNIWYITRQYFEHPINKYHVYGIAKGNNRIDSIIIVREQVQNGVKILRIVDFIGLDSDFAGIGCWVQSLIDKHDYEYIDCYCKGISKEIMNQAGFTLRDESDINIIPNYFAPFLRANVDIHYYTSDDDGYYMFKADGDQDRPNIRR